MLRLQHRGPSDADNATCGPRQSGMLQLCHFPFAAFATFVAFAAFVSDAVDASIHCCNCRVDIAVDASSCNLDSISLACNNFTKSLISDPEKVWISPTVLISSCASVIKAQSNPFIFLFRILLDIRVFGASSLADFVPFISTPFFMSYRWFGVLQLQQFVTYAVIVAYHDSVGGVAIAIYFCCLCIYCSCVILLCLQHTNCVKKIQVD